LFSENREGQLWEKIPDYYIHPHRFLRIVQMQFANYSDAKYPPKTKYFYDEYYDELDRERESWY